MKTKKTIEFDGVKYNISICENDLDEQYISPTSSALVYAIWNMTIIDDTPSSYAAAIMSKKFRMVFTSSDIRLLRSKILKKLEEVINE